MKSVDITTIVGCPNSCTYCPQDKLLSNYYGEKLLSIDKFKTMLDNISKHVIINFAGYSENMFNREIAEMMVHAYEQKFRINLFTTLIGLTDEKINRLKDTVTFNYVNFHKFNGKYYRDSSFYNSVEKFVRLININRYDVQSVQSKVFTRASNLKDTYVERKLGRIRCDFYTNNNVWDCNQILPNGDVYLCCMDWALKHKIGNVFLNEYGSEEFNKKRLEIELSMVQNDSDLLCRNCEFAKQINDI